MTPNFSRAATPVPTNKPVRALVTTGIHGRTRNPIYLGMFLVYGSAAWVAGVCGPSLVLFSGSADGSAALWLAASGALLGVAGVALVVRSRAELGPAWSFVPKAGQETGLVTTGPYRLVRHPIYLGLVLLAMGEALAFGSWPAVAIVLFGIIPTFAWRARVEESLLGRTFGESYTLYRKQTRMLIPHLL